MKKYAKKIISAALASAMALSSYGVSPAAAENVTVVASDVNAYADTEVVYEYGEAKLYFDTSTGTITGLSIPNEVTEITIPDTIEGVAVTSIGDSAFEYFGNLTSITLPTSLTSIGKYAFRYCKNLTSITIPNGVTSIGNGAFSGCSGITGINLPASLTAIEDSAFSGCSGLTDITIPKGITKINGGVFKNCSSLTSIILPEGLTAIDNYAFNGCSSLTTITIPETVITIGSYVFEDCSSLTNITIPKAVTSISYGAFAYCDNMEKVYCYKGSVADDASLYNEGVTIVYIGEGETETTSDYSIEDGKLSINDNAVMSDYDTQNSPWSDYKDEITKVEISFRVEKIGNSAFKDFTALNNAELSTGITFIGSNAFKGCSSLSELIIPDTVTSIGALAFADLAPGAVIYNYSNVEITPEHYGVGGDIMVYQAAFIAGDADLNGVLTANDAAINLEKSLNGDYIPKIQRYASNYTDYMDVNGDNVISAADAAYILQKSLDSNFVFKKT